MNGNAIQDHYRNDLYAATNIRVFDPSQDTWLVTYFRYPNYRSGTWEGGEEGKEIVLRRTFDYGGQAVLSELVFSNVSDEGFYWESKYVSGDDRFVNWTSSCRRET